MEVPVFKINVFIVIWLMLLPTGAVLLLDNYTRQRGGVWAQSYDIAIIYLIISAVSYYLGRYKHPARPEEVK